MSKNQGWCVVGLLLAAMVISQFSAAPVHAASSAGDRPKIGVVLSGGGARGAAHVGVLRVLEQQRIPIDYIAGTSMGSIIGGLYAAGMSPDEIEQAIEEIDWETVFNDDPERPVRSFRRKRDDDLYLIKAKPGFNDGEIELPLAAIHGQKFDLILNQLLLPVAHVHDFDQLQVPFRAVATDLETGRAVVLGKGNLTRSLRASMAVPGAFDPVEIDGRLLVDGGVADNMPIQVTRDMGADIVIAVDISGQLRSRKKIKSVLHVLDQMTTILTKRNVEAQLATLTPRDILIDLRDELGGIGSGDFDRIRETIPIGERGAQQAIPRLQALATAQSEYAQRVAATEKPMQGPMVVDFVRIENQSGVGDDVIAARLRQQPGEPLDIEQLREDIERIYGLDNFETVRYEIVEENGQRGLVLHAKEKPWGPAYLQFGARLSSSLGTDSNDRYNLGISYLRMGINELNGELRLVGQIGDEPSLGAELYQPLDPLSRYFFHIKGALVSENERSFRDGNVVADYQIDRAGLDLAVGRELGTWGEFRLGYFFAVGDAEKIIAEPGFRHFDFQQGELSVQLALDTLDSAEWPRHGQSGRVLWRASRAAIAADEDFDQVEASYALVNSWGENTFGVALTLQSTLDDDAPLYSLFSTGGFTRLSGYAQDELSGQQMGLLRGVYYRRLFKKQVLQFYAGASVEYGNVWQDQDDVSLSDGILAGSAFLGADTPIGPVYLGYGQAEAGHRSVYFFLGRLF